MSRPISKHDLTPGIWQDQSILNYHDYTVRVHDDLSVTWIGKMYNGQKLSKDEWAGTQDDGWVQISSAVDDPHIEDDY
jgi:hypothetical protein